MDKPDVYARPIDAAPSEDVKALREALGQAERILVSVRSLVSPRSLVSLDEQIVALRSLTPQPESEDTPQDPRAPTTERGKLLRAMRRVTHCEKDQSLENMVLDLYRVLDSTRFARPPQPENDR